MSPSAGGAPLDAGACADIVARDDPHLHATALFAAEPGRSQLMVLYAFDVELSRAALASSESLIPRMRLQWWRDVAEAARSGAPPPAHEVAGPFAALAARALPAGPVEALIDSREAELSGGFDEAGFSAWADRRFGALTGLAAGLLTEGDAAAEAFARRAGPVLGRAFALRHARAMAAEGRSLLPGLSAADRAALADGGLSPGARRTVRRLAAGALETLATLRAHRSEVDRRATPALLPLTRAGRVLRRALRAAGTGPVGAEAPKDASAGQAAAQNAPGSEIAPMRNFDDADRPFDGLRLAWAAATGRW